MPEYVTKIRTTAGDLPYDYNSLANKPNIASDALLDEEGNANPLREHAENHAIGGYDYIEPNSIGAAKIPVMMIVNLPLIDPGWGAQTDGETGETYYTQEVQVNGVDSDPNTQWISVSPTPNSEEAYNAAKVTATAQGENSITFSASSIPAVNEVQCAIEAYVVIQDVSMQTNQVEEGTVE